jgi:hypothetical protein
MEPADLRTFHSVPSEARLRADLPGLDSTQPSGAAFLIKYGADPLIGPRCVLFQWLQSKEHTLMGHELHRSGSFWSFLLSIDKDLADSAGQPGCSCGRRLHCANWPRAPQGRPDHLPEEYRYRLSFCCDREGCRIQSACI